MDISERFWSYVDRSGGPDACWLWTGGKDRHGYGRFFIAKKPASLNSAKAHRVAFCLANERHLAGMAAGMLEVAHSCDNPGCVNPAHLSAVLHRENVRQMHERGRFRGGRRAQAVSP